ncbi:MAG: hypothetical protein OEZ13_01005 [Spirochaetia bacterium]|nr:hypothetical protein [Spirochaetia bacterium]
MKSKNIYFLMLLAMTAFLYCPKNEEIGNSNQCETITAYDYGICSTFLGYAFDGGSCVGISGCGCGDDCGLFYSTLEDCNGACGIYLCPEESTINCMPIVLPENQDYCTEPYTN